MPYTDTGALRFTQLCRGVSRQCRQDSQEVKNFCKSMDGDVILKACLWYVCSQAEVEAPADRCRAGCAIQSSDRAGKARS